MNDLYLNIFTDGLLSSLVVPLRSQTTFFAMKAFGEHDVQTMAIAGIFAAGSATLGHALNWGIGKIILECSKRYKPISQHAAYQKFQRYFLYGGVLALAFSWMPLFGIVSTLSGFFGIKSRYALPLIFIGQAAFFFYHLQ